MSIEGCRAGRCLGMIDGKHSRMRGRACWGRRVPGTEFCHAHQRQAATRTPATDAAPHAVTSAAAAAPALPAVLTLGAPEVQRDLQRAAHAAGYRAALADLRRELATAVVATIALEAGAQVREAVRDLVLEKIAKLEACA